MEFLNSRTEVLIETVEITKITRRGAETVFCNSCGTRVSPVTDDDAADAVARTVKADRLPDHMRLHRLADGQICSDSLVEFISSF